MKSPLVSVIMASYNHACFVRQAIESVLCQRDVDFEFLITDDGSVDTTRDVINSIRDHRIKFYPNQINRGACVVTNELINRASGEYIALINSDDYWIRSDKLACQIKVLNENPTVGACFGRARFVDRDGCTISKSNLPFGHVFDQKNRSRGAWLRHFFDLGNCICHPTMLIRKSCYDVVGVYDNRLRQLPDFDMWVRLAKRYDIHVSDMEMTAFRHIPGENTSSDTPVNYRRILNESYFILERFFNGISRDVFLDGFRNLLLKPEIPDEIHMDIEQALLFLSANRWASHIYNMIGLEKIHFLLGSGTHRRILADCYGIDDRAFHVMSAEKGVFERPDPNEQLSFVKSLSLLREVKRRIMLRLPFILRSAMDKIPKLFNQVP